MNCPKCGNAAALDGHTIAEDGTVSPSVVCPFKVKTKENLEEPCGFHDHVRLSGWGKI